MKTIFSIPPRRTRRFYDLHALSLSEKLTRRYYPVTLCLD
jgi:hypothetical protein